LNCATTNFHHEKSNIALCAHRQFVASAQIHIQLPAQHLGDTTVLANRYNLSDSLLRCDSCFVDLRTIRKNVKECYSEITETASPIQLASACADNYINQGSTQTACSFYLPDDPVSGQICRMVFENAVTTLNIATGTGSTIITTSATSSSVFVYKYYASAWKRIQ